jgi:hypothetical protein
MIAEQGLIGFDDQGLVCLGQAVLREGGLVAGLSGMRYGVDRAATVKSVAAKDLNGFMFVSLVL